MGKKWEKPQLITIKRGQQENVLTTCKTSYMAGPGGSVCGADTDLYCCRLAGRS